MSEGVLSHADKLVFKYYFNVQLHVKSTEFVITTRSQVGQL